jgi:sulfite exporter TauE/SafE
MEFSLLAVLMVGFVLGIKHAVEPDHVIAVSTIAAKSKSLWRSSLAGVFWGVGHTATLFIVGLVLILMKNEIPEKWALSLEFTVGIMLVYLGISSVFKSNAKKIHFHDHEHDGYVHNHFHETHRHEHKETSYVKSMIIGMVHGLAGSAAMVLLTMTTVSTVWQAIVYILVFGVGTVIGMLLFTTIIGLPFVFSANNVRVNDVLIRMTGLVSTVFGFYYMYNLGITEGLFKLWIQ